MAHRRGWKNVFVSKTLDKLIGKGLKVKSVVTERHVGIRSLMKKEYAANGVDHQFDAYHIANSFRKKLTELTKKKRHADLVQLSLFADSESFFSGSNI